MTELERMRARMGSLPRAFEMYSGEFKEIDLDAVWYCPECLRLEAKLIRGRDSVYCTHNHQVCEYECHNAAGRERTQMVWSKRFTYPLTLAELQATLLDRKKQYLANCKVEFQALRKTIKRLSNEIEDEENGGI